MGKKAKAGCILRKQMSIYAIVFLDISCIINSKFSDSISVMESCQEASKQQQFWLTPWKIYMSIAL